MRPSSSSSDVGDGGEPFAFLAAAGPVAAETTAAAWLRAMLDVEAALAAAQAAAGLIPRDSAATIAALCRPEAFDVDAVFAAAALGGNPAIPLVERLRETVGADVSAHVHMGATSQDIVDSAAMIVVRRSGGHVKASLGRTAEALDVIAAAHGGAPMMGRTLLQHALPSSLGNVLASWIDGLNTAQEAIGSVVLPLQLGGPVGDGLDGDVAADVARRVGLAVAPRPWHAQRSPIAALAGAWGLAAAAISSVATDIVVLASSDIGELHEEAAGAGGSSSMPHKRNPVAAVCARAAAMQVPGLVSTLLSAAGQHELQRAAGAWHAEWPALNAMLRATGSAAEWLATSIDRLVVDTERIAAHVAAGEAPGGAAVPKRVSNPERRDRQPDAGSEAPSEGRG